MPRREAIVRATSVFAGNAPRPRTSTYAVALNVEEVDGGCTSRKLGKKEP
jgi:hypothetical protein